MSTWEGDAEQYISRYLIGEPFFETAGLRFGRRFSEALESPDTCTDEGLLEGIEKLDVLDLIEYKMKQEMPGGLPTVAKYDSLSFDRAKFLEYKTGSGDYPWDADRVKNHSQMMFYTALLYVNTGYVFDSELQWLETYQVPISDRHPEGIAFTGRCEKHAFRPTMAATEEFISRMYKVANEIALGCHYWKTKEMPALINAKMLFEYLEAYRTAERAKAVLKSLEAGVKNELHLNDLKYLEAWGGRLKITAKGNLTAKILYDE